MKKWLSILLVAVMCFSVLSACGIEIPDKSDRSDTQQDADTESGYRDFYEEEFWAMYHIGSDHWNYFWPEPTTEDKERVREISSAVEQALNCKLMEEGTTNPVNSMQVNFATGNYKFHYSFYSVASMTLHALYKAGYLQSWNDIPTLDLSRVELYGDLNKQAAATFDGEVYAISGGKGVADYGHLIYNQIMINRLNVPTPRALDEQDQWTWATFEDYLKTITTEEDGLKTYGMSVYANGSFPSAILGMTAIFSNGGEIVRFDENGQARFAVTDNDAIEALQWAADLHATGTVVMDTVFPPKIWASEGAVMILSNTVFGTGSTGSTEHWGLDNLEDIRFMRFPTGPKGDKTKHTGTYSLFPYGDILLFGTDKESSGYVYNVRSEMSYETAEEDNTAWIRKTFFGDDANDFSSYEYYDYGCNNGALSYVAQMGDKVNTFFDTVYEVSTGLQTPMQGMSSISAVIQSELDASLNN